ncbi:hypothetical protein KKB84_03425 [bacterium]|nr:hypothetical protein [bacterium]MBU1153004.1 hypothetical protein [bacterium]MBU1782511.1 hypothetical protein [bacterium]
MGNEVKKILNSQKGTALAIALYLSAFIIVVIAGFEIWNAYNFKSTISDKKKIAGYYYAESGLEKALYKLIHTEEGTADYDPVFQKNIEKLIVQREVDCLNPFNNNVNEVGVVNFEEGKVKVRIERFP